MFLRSTIHSARKFFLLIIIIGTVSQISTAQNLSTGQAGKQIDSLLSVLKTAKEDTSKVNTLNALSNHLWKTSNYTEAKKYADEGLSLSGKLNYKKGTAASYNNIGYIYSLQYKYPAALENHLASLKINEEVGDKNGIADSHDNIGNIYYQQAKYPEALKKHLIALKLKEELGDKSGIANIHNNIGSVYTRLSNYPEALKNTLVALKIREKIGDKDGIAGSYYNMGRINFGKGNYPEALKNYLTSLGMYNELGEKKGIAYCYDGIGVIYYRQEKYPEALKNFLASLKLREEIGDKRGLAESYMCIGNLNSDLGNYAESLKNFQASFKIKEEIGDIRGIAVLYGSVGWNYYLQGNYPEALKNYLAGLKISEEIGEKIMIALALNNLGRLSIKLNKLADAKKHLDRALGLSKEIGSIFHIVDDYNILSKLDSLRGDFKSAYEHHRMYILYRDSLLNIETEEKMVRQQMQFDFDKKEDSLNYQQDLADSKLKQQVLLTRQQKQAKNYFIAGIGLLGILSYFLYRNYRTRQKLKLQVFRNKIASDLHDDVGSTLSSISIFSEMAKQQSKEVIPMLDTIGESSRKMLDAMADIVWTINPENDQFDKIILRMKGFAFEMLGAKKIDFEFEADDEAAKMKLPMDVRKNLYLIFKEATNNMVKYAGASKALFAIKGEKNNLTMMIRDNGKGFDISQSTGGNGLKNMKKRAEEIGADFSIDTHPGEGTTIQLRVAV